MYAYWFPPALDHDWVYRSKAAPGGPLVALGLPSTASGCLPSLPLWSQGIPLWSPKGSGASLGGRLRLGLPLAHSDHRKSTHTPMNIIFEKLRRAKLVRCRFQPKGIWFPARNPHSTEWIWPVFPARNPHSTEWIWPVRFVRMSRPIALLWSSGN